MDGLKRTYRTLAITIPALLLTLAVLTGALKDPSERSPTVFTMVFGALPFLIVLLFLRRRREAQSDPVRFAGVHFAARATLWYNAALVILPIVYFILRPRSGVNFGAIALFVLEPLYVYPMLLLLERIGRRQAARRISRAAHLAP